MFAIVVMSGLTMFCIVWHGSMWFRVVLCGFVWFSMVLRGWVWLVVVAHVSQCSHGFAWFWMICVICMMCSFCNLVCTLCKFFAFFPLQRRKENLKFFAKKMKKSERNFYLSRNYRKVSKSCNHQLELWMHWNWVSYLVLFMVKPFWLTLIIWSKVNFCVKCSKIVIFEPKCHTN